MGVELMHTASWPWFCIDVPWRLCSSQTPNSGRNLIRIAMIWPKPGPDCHPKKVVFAPSNSLSPLGIPEYAYV